MITSLAFWKLQLSNGWWPTGPAADGGHTLTISKDVLPYAVGVAAIAAVPLAISYFYYIDPVIRRLIFGGEFDYAAIRDERLKKGRAHKNLGMGGPEWMLVGAHAGKWLLYENKNNILSGTHPSVEDIVGGSIITQNGATHAHTRRMMAPAFRSDIIRSYVPGVLRTTINEMEHWASKCSAPDSYIDLEHALKQLALRFALTLLVGAEISDEEHELSGQLAKQYEHLFDASLPWPLGPWDGKERSKQSRQAVLRDVEAIIRKRIQRLESGYEPKDMDPLWLLIKSKDEDGKSLTVPELTNHALLLVIAGHETTARILGSFAVRCIQNPTLLSRLRTEQSTIQKHSNTLTEIDLKAMTYMDAVFREIERLEPPVPYTSRQAIKDLVYTPTDTGISITIKAGSTISWDMASTNRDPELYTDPDTFLPDRWLTTSSSPTTKTSLITDASETHDLGGSLKISNFKLATFGAGHRVCLGMQFARMEMVAVGAVLVRDYEFTELREGCRVERSVPLFTNKKRGAEVRFLRRSM
ncbi:hypothetical protein HDV00_007436 [Rhizophlyctis rosea]|nr:hypothetical protein HDV00_007436 [Rhizophlyctis rosea]